MSRGMETPVMLKTINVSGAGAQGPRSVASYLAEYRPIRRIESAHAASDKNAVSCLLEDRDSMFFNNCVFN